MNIVYETLRHQWHKVDVVYIQTIEKPQWSVIEYNDNKDSPPIVNLFDYEIDAYKFASKISSEHLIAMQKKIEHYQEIYQLLAMSTRNILQTTCEVREKFNKPLIDKLED